MIKLHQLGRKATLLLLVLAFFVHAPASAARKHRGRPPGALGAHINYILKQTTAHRGFWGIEVVRLRDGKVLYQQNEDHLFTPASNMKLFTTALALEKLGPDFVFRTTVESPSPPDANGRVGDLILVGRGDANLGGRVLPYHLKTERREPADAVFRELADQVAARGVREVQGNLVADDSYFLFEPYGEDWAAGDLEWAYGAPVTALAFNDNELSMHVQPAATIGEKALVSFDPIPDYYQLINRLETTGASAKPQIEVDRPMGSMLLNVWGHVPLGPEVEADSISIENPPQLMGEMFAKLLEARGIKVQGHVQVKHFTPMEAATTDNRAPAATVVLAEHRSLPLSEDIKVTNKVSQNLHAEMLLRTTGREVKGAGSLATGLDVLRGFVAAAGVPPDAFYFADGSGLSRKALIAPEAMIRLLTYMTRSPRFAVFYNSLPVAGIDGSLSERFLHSPAAGHIHAKTGTITHVNSLSGYMDLPSGERLAFSIFGNSHSTGAHGGAGTVDAIALAIYEKFAGRGKFRRRSRAARNE